MGPPERSLRDVLADGPMQPAQVVTLISQIAEDLDSSPSQGRTRRVIAPDHIVVAADGSARLVGAPRQISELTGETPVPVELVDYLAPEVFLSNAADGSVDVYALACLVYHCLTGQPPYPAAGLESKILGHLSSPPPKPSALNPAVPFAFDAVIATGMAKEPPERFRTAGELAQAAAQTVQTVTDLLADRKYPYPDAGSDGGRHAIADTVAMGRNIALVTAPDDATFVTNVFPHLPSGTELYVLREKRNGYERGAHFDVYQGLLHDGYPFVATFNLVGDASLVTTLLPADLTAYYFKHHAVLSDVAHRARRLVSDLALMRPGATVTRSEIGPGVGLIIPQPPIGYQPVVHDVRPPAQYGRGSYGMFLKFIVPKDDSSIRSFVTDLGFEPWRPGTSWYAAAEVRGRPYEPPQPD